VTQATPVLRNISDTAFWVAVYRGRETDRPDALFRDPLAKRLAGTRGEQMAAALPFSAQHSWTWPTRTWLFDQYVTEQIAQGVDTVINLAAGLDARPYRMPLPSTLRWIEIDLPDLLDYKDQVLQDQTPRCSLERIRLDLSDVPARRQLFRELGHNARKALVITEGLLIYLSPQEVGSLAEDLAAPATFQSWCFDLTSPRLLAMLQKNMNPHLSRAGAPLKFGPAEGPGFFTPFGWKPRDARSMLTTAARLRRLPWWMRLLAMLPEPKPPYGSRPWGGICLVGK